MTGHSLVFGLGMFCQQISRDKVLLALIAFELPDARVNVTHVRAKIQLGLERPSAEFADAWKSTRRRRRRLC